MRKRMPGSLEEIWLKPEDAVLLTDTETKKLGEQDDPLVSRGRTWP